MMNDEPHFTGINNEKRAVGAIRLVHRGTSERDGTLLLVCGVAPHVRNIFQHFLYQVHIVVSIS